MESIFDAMMDQSAEESTSDPEVLDGDTCTGVMLCADDATDNYDINLKLITDQIRDIKPPRKAAKTRAITVEVADFDSDNNILNPAVCDEFKNGSIFNESDIFTHPVSTTNTMGGYISNVSFHEEELISEVMPDDHVVVYRCNYGIARHEGYTEPTKIKKTNRGRKKKERKRKARKKQGNGTEFNSQITFVFRAALAHDKLVDLSSIAGDTSKVYKFKVFRTGKIQLPGVHQYQTDDVIFCAKKIATILNFHLHPGESDPAKVSHVININPVMKNYKFVIKVPSRHIIDLGRLKTILFNERAKENCEFPPIFMIKYTRQDTKLSVKFTTPIYKKPKKKTRINIFMRGKVNILGAFDSKVTTQICMYLHGIFEDHFGELMVPIGVPDMSSKIEPWSENIHPLTDDEYHTTLGESINWFPDLPQITNQEYDELMIICNSEYAMMMTHVEVLLSTLV